MDPGVKFVKVVGVLRTSWLSYTGAVVIVATATSCATAEVLLTHTTVEARLGIRIHLAGGDMAGCGVGFVFLGGPAMLVLTRYTIIVRLGVEFLFLHGAVIVVLAIYMIVRTVAARLPDGGCVVGDGILSAGADVL